MKENISEFIRKNFPRNRNYVIFSVKSKKQDKNGNTISYCDFYSLEIDIDSSIPILTKYNEVFSKIFSFRKNKDEQLIVNDYIDTIQENMNYFLEREEIKKQIIFKILK